MVLRLAEAGGCSSPTHLLTDGWIRCAVPRTHRSKFASQREAEEWGASTLLQFRSDYFGTGGDLMLDEMSEFAMSPAAIQEPQGGP